MKQIIALIKHLYTIIWVRLKLYQRKLTKVVNILFLFISIASLGFIIYEFGYLGLSPGTKILKQKYGIEFFVMDYFKSTGSKNFTDSYFNLGNDVDFVKNEICGQLGMYGMAAAQLNRQGVIGESYKIEQYVSVLSYISEKSLEERRNDGPECGNYKQVIAANRLGQQMDIYDPDDYIDLNFRGNYCRFDAAKKQHERVDLIPD